MLHDDARGAVTAFRQIYTAQHVKVSGGCAGFDSKEGHGNANTCRQSWARDALPVPRDVYVTDAVAKLREVLLQMGLQQSGTVAPQPVLPRELVALCWPHLLMTLRLSNLSINDTQCGPVLAAHITV